MSEARGGGCGVRPGADAAPPCAVCYTELYGADPSCGGENEPRGYYPETQLQPPKPPERAQGGVAHPGLKVGLKVGPPTLPGCILWSPLPSPTPQIGSWGNKGGGGRGPLE